MVSLTITVSYIVYITRISQEQTTECTFGLLLTGSVNATVFCLQERHTFLAIYYD